MQRQARFEAIQPLPSEGILSLWRAGEARLAVKACRFHAGACAVRRLRAAHGSGFSARRGGKLPGATRWENVCRYQ